MLFSSQSSDQLNALSADSNASSLQTTSAALLSTTSSGLIDPIQQSNRLGASSASLDSATTAEIIVGGSPDLSTDITSNALPSTTLTALTSTTLIDVIPYYPRLGTEGGSTLDTATNLGSLTGTPQSITAWWGVSTTDPNDYYRVTLDVNSNFNLSMTGLTADADVQFLNSVGTEIASSIGWNNHDEAINVSGLAAGDYYIRVYQYSGNTGFSLDLSSTPSSTPSNLLPNEFELGTTINYPGTTQTGSISNTNTADTYHFSLDGFYQYGGEFPGSAYANYSNLTLSLTGMSADADVRIIRDVNHNGLADPGEEIVRSALGGTNSESIHLDGLGVGDYFAQVYQYNGATNYTLNLSAYGSRSGGYAGDNNNSFSQAYEVNTLNGHRALSGSVNGNVPAGGYGTPNEYYHFNLGTTSNFNLSLAGLYTGGNLQGDADVQLLNSSGTVINFSDHWGTATESISQTLAAGDYYVRVYAYQSAFTNFTMDLNATPV